MIIANIIVDLDNAEFGIWHDDCLLPALVRIPVLMEGQVVTHFSYCDHCNEDDDDRNS